MKRAKLEIDLDYDIYRLIKDSSNTVIDGSNDVRTFASDFVNAIKNSKLIETYEKRSLSAMKEYEEDI